MLPVMARRIPGDFGDLFDGIFRRALFQLVKAVAPFLDELMIVEVFLDDHVDHAEGERRVGAAANLKPKVGLRGEPSELGIDDDQLAATLHAVDHPVPQVAVGV